MKKSLIAVAALAITGAAAAGSSETVVVDIDWGTGDTGPVGMASFSLPDLVSIDSICVDISHTWGADINMSVAGDTNGSMFELMNDNDSADGGNYDMGVAGTGTLDDVAAYEFVETGTLISDLGAGDFLGGVTGLQANSWTAGALGADTYTFSVEDLVGGDGGAIGSLVIKYTAVPAPGAVALLGLAGLAGTRRRRA